jgi:biopolymer transport protein ExbB/TolQ
LEALKHVGGFAVAAGAFGTLTGLFQAFGALEEAKDVIPFNVICGGMKVALITVLYGLIVYMISMLFYISLTLLKTNKN